MRILLVIVLIFFSVAPLYADEGAGFSEWLQGFKVEALAQGIAPGVVEQSLAGLKYSELVIKLDRNQPEFKLSLKDYLARTASESRVKKGRAKLQDHRSLLEEVAVRYGVPPKVMVALWGIETDFGRVTGSFPVVEALATLSYDPRRSDFFKRELFAALHVVNDGYIPLKKLEGSWAGAIGFLQFLPSVFRKYGVDYNKDGQITIWQASGDLFASGANYLADSGWQSQWKWGREVVVPTGFPQKDMGLKNKAGLADWQKRGVRRLNGADLPLAQLSASLIQPDNDVARYFLVYDNFRVLMKWNRSVYYGVAVGLLSDLLAIQQNTIK